MYINFFCSHCPFDPFYLSSQNKNEDVHTCLVWNSNLELILNRGNKKILMDRSYLNWYLYSSNLQYTGKCVSEMKTIDIMNTIPSKKCFLQLIFLILTHIIWMSCSTKREHATTSTVPPKLEKLCKKVTVNFPPSVLSFLAYISWVFQSIVLISIV